MYKCHHASEQDPFVQEKKTVKSIAFQSLHLICYQVVL